MAVLLLGQLFNHLLVVLAQVDKQIAAFHPVVFAQEKIPEEILQVAPVALYALEIIGVDWRAKDDSLRRPLHPLPSSIGIILLSTICT